MEIRGWDWVELCPVFGITYDENVEDEETLAALREAIGEDAVFYTGAIEGGPTAEVQKRTDLVREFTRKLSEQEHTYTSPLWKGLANIEESWTFLKYVNILLPYMWD